MTPVPVELHAYRENGVEVTTHSMMKSMHRCPKQFQYKYVERLKPRFATANDKALKRGTWYHSLLEEYYSGRDWLAKHRELTQQFNELFDEEKDALGDLPDECERLMRSYLWHYGVNKDDPFHGWKVLNVEQTLECEWPDGRGIYRGRTDMLIEDQYGLWIVDHKTHKTLPDLQFRMLDAASALYIWAAWENGLKVNGFIWNYIRTKAPSKPALVDVKRTPRLSKSAIDTDYPTMHRAITEYGLKHEDYREQLLALKRQRWTGHTNTPQTSSFFRRETLVKDEAMIARVVAAAMRTRDRAHDYGWEDLESVERHVDRSCSYFCSFRELCTAEMFGGDGKRIRQQQYKVGDPMDYYRDQKDKAEQ